MQEAELKYADRLKNGTPQNFADLLGSDNSKKRKRRTSFTPQALEILNEAFDKNTHPSGADMTLLSNRLNYDREVIRVWFCNKRQAFKNTVKKYKSGETTPIQNTLNGSSSSSGILTALTTNGNNSGNTQATTSIFVTAVPSNNANNTVNNDDSTAQNAQTVQNNLNAVVAAAAVVANSTSS